jgi:hypothetical protein
MKKYAQLLSLAGFMCMLLVVSGCSPKHPDTNPYEKMSKAEMKYSNIQVVNFTISSKGVQETDKPNEILAEAQTACATALANSKLFETVKTVSSAEKENSTLIVQGELTKLRIVGGGARFWIGAMAGKSEMAVYVKLINASTGLVVTESRIGDDSNPTSGAWSIGATDRALPSQVGNLIADLVVSTAKK